MAKIRFYPFSKETQAMSPAPTPASKNIPDWYKKQPAYGASDEEQMLKTGGSASTVKRCMPIFDIINSGYIIYIPCDIYMDATDPEKLKWSLPSFATQVKRDLVSSHAPEQVSHYPLNEKQYHKEIFRIMPFWAVGTDKGYSSLFTQPFHSDPTPFRTFGGVVDTDKFIADGHYSIQIEKGFKGVIERGTPLVQVIPFKRDNYSMELVEVEQSNKILLSQRLLIRSKFKNFYRNNLRVAKDYK
jgi:hypothetical protein